MRDEFQTIGSCSGGDPFALQVLGDSMEPEFPEGCIVVIDPAGVIEDGVYVFAKHHDEFIFRQLRIHDSQYQLVPLNPAYPTLDIDGISAIEGRIVQRAGRRRSDRKHYT